MIKATSLIDARDRIQWANNSIITIPVTKYNNDGPFFIFVFIIFLVLFWFWMMLNGFDARTLSIVNNLFRNSDFKSNARGLHNISYFLFISFIILFIILSKLFLFQFHVTRWTCYKLIWILPGHSMSQQENRPNEFIKYISFFLLSSRAFFE